MGKSVQLGVAPMTHTVECPKCGHENEYDPDNDVILCEECNEMIFIPETTEAPE